MALYALCGTTSGILARPCALVEAASAGEALRAGEKMRRNGDLLFLPAALHMSARRASRREASAYRDHMLVRPEDTILDGRDPGYAQRARRRELAFFQRLWNGALVPPPAAAQPPGGSSRTDEGGVRNDAGDGRTSSQADEEAIDDEGWGDEGRGDWGDDPWGPEA